MPTLATRLVHAHNGAMPIRSDRWLFLLMALVMALTAPLQVMASSLHAPVAVCPAMAGDRADAAMAGHGAHATAGEHGMTGEHCTLPDHSAADGQWSAAGPHDDCDATCSGTCGVCAHCPVGIGAFFAPPDLPPRQFFENAQHKPGNVAPDAALRPPRSFS